MKQLILVRHGKSSWDYQVNDRDRPLKERGINDGHLVASTFGAQKVELDAVFSSPANRALHTCMIFLRKLNFPLTKFRVTNELYDFSGEDVLNFVGSLPNSLNTVMIFGHNYAFTNIANSLGNKYIDNVPTSGLVQLHFDVTDWKKLAKGTTKQMLFPKTLR